MDTKLLDTKKLFSKQTPITEENLGDAIQQAIEIEIATIPTYLYTYYSIIRSPNQNVMSGEIALALVRKGKSPEEANKIAIDLSAEIMVFANKAGALIMSVAIEEMLHMALSSNLKQALAGKPKLVGKSPAVWPAYLPGHIPPFPIHKARLSPEQLITFLKIESPNPLNLTAAQNKKYFDYRTIGEFYLEIENFIENNPVKFDKKSPQLIPGKGYYAQNNIDTVYYDKHHNPRLVNADDSGDLVCVHDKKSASLAIDTIIHQGEGHTGHGLLPGDKVDCSVYPGDFDDHDKKEFSHFEKFARIYCWQQKLHHTFDKLGISDINFDKYVVANVPLDPLTAQYPSNVQPVSNLLNAVYTYIFVMTEGCYRQTTNTQYEIFMFGIHKSMIFILNSLCGDIMGLSYTAADGKTYTVAPTFEDYPFGFMSSPKSQLIDLYNAAVKVYPTISYLAQRFQDLPDVDLQS